MQDFNEVLLEWSQISVSKFRVDFSYDFISELTQLINNPVENGLNLRFVERGFLQFLLDSLGNESDIALGAFFMLILASAENVSTDKYAFIGAFLIQACEYGLIIA